MRWTGRLGLYEQATVIRTARLDGELAICVTVDVGGMHLHNWLGLEHALELAQALQAAALEVAESDDQVLPEVPF